MNIDEWSVRPGPLRGPDNSLKFQVLAQVPLRERGGRAKEAVWRRAAGGHAIVLGYA